MKILNTLKKSKMALLGVASTIATVSANAAVSYDGTTNAFTGTFDLGPYYSAIGIVITAIAVVAAIKLAVGQFKRV